jgi:SRSO17 transposase
MRKRLVRMVLRPNAKGVTVKGFMNELKGFHSEFAGCFTRSEPREHFFQYMAGQFGEVERKSIEPIALTVEGGNVRSLQRFIANVPWDEEKMIGKYHALINEDMGDPNGVVIFDESVFVKKGNDSAGVARQYCGTTGKVENCQVGVFAAYASPHGYALLDKNSSCRKSGFSIPTERNGGSAGLMLTYHSAQNHNWLSICLVISVMQA